MATFLNIDKVTGEATEENHKEWIDIQSWSWGGYNASNVGYGSGAASGSSVINALQVTCKASPASMTLMKYLLLGTHIPNIKLEQTKTTGTGEKPWVKIELTNSMITSLNQSSDGAEIYDSMEISYEHVRGIMEEQDASGNLISTKEFGWNCKTRVDD
jgi:type VI secretion system secreted protein Hcp